MSVEHGMASHPHTSLLIPEGEMKREEELGGWRKEYNTALNPSRSLVVIVSVTQNEDCVVV